ncbi:MAG: peptidoglycan editing factor PgeF [Hyphomicrobium sp.]|nr:peptidoglycan editing factor PgeF [Hyphomicrobium sp.]
MLTPIQAPILTAHSNIRHGFFTRAGGTSSGLYASLNCGLGSADDYNGVLENRRLVADHLGAQNGRVVTLHQEHGNITRTVTAAIPRDRVPNADAIVTKTPGLAIGVLTADCGPILLADAEVGIVAATHAGWRGALDGIVQSTVTEMVRIGARRERIVAAVGPCISQQAYEVGPELETEFLVKDLMNAGFFIIPPGSSKPHFDLSGYIVHQLKGVGVAKVETMAICTYENESEFFSYRRATHQKQADYGRQISAIVVA